MADDDVLWRTMCEQHIERKCERCGWGLPLLGERRRKARGAINALPARAVERSSRELDTRRVVATGHVAMDMPQHAAPTDDATIVGSELNEDSTSTSTPSNDEPMNRPFKRSKTESPAPSRANTPPPGSSSSRPHSGNSSTVSLPPIVSTRPWKSVYCERLAIERNWRRGTCVATVLSGHTDSITCLQVAEDLPHPAFPILMTGSWDRSVRIWNLESGKEVGVLRGHTRGVRALKFDAVKLVTGSMDSTLKIWNWRTGECMRTLRGHRDAVICLTYDKQLLISGSADSTIRVWDFGTGEGYTLRGHTEWVNSVALWDSKIGCGPGQEAPGSADDGAPPITNPEQAKLTSKGKYLFSASDDMTIRVWDLYTRECVRVLKGHVAQVQSLRIITSDDPACENSDPAPPSIPASAPLPPCHAPSTSAPTTSVPATSSTTTTTTTNEAELVSDRHQAIHDNVYEDFFDAATASTRSCVTPVVLPLPVPAQPPPAGPFVAAPLPLPDSTSLAFLEFAGEERPLIVSASLDNTIKTWDVEKGICTRTMFGHIEGVWDVDVDKLRIVSGSHDRTLKVCCSILLFCVRVGKKTNSYF
jgi:F-box/WD-40 domain protein MET30